MCKNAYFLETECRSDRDIFHTKIIMKPPEKNQNVLSSRLLTLKRTLPIPSYRFPLQKFKNPGSGNISQAITETTCTAFSKGNMTTENHAQMYTSC